MTIIKNRSRSIPPPLITQLDSRDVALWLGSSEDGELDPPSAGMLCRLPWNVVLSEGAGNALIAELERPEKIDDPMVRRRGLIHIIDTDPSETILPRRHLAIMLLNGRNGQRASGLAAQTRQLTMLQDLRRRSLKQLVVVQPGSFTVPDGLTALWADGFRTTLTFVSDDPGAAEALASWAQEFGATLVDLVARSHEQFAQELQESYLDQREGAVVYRVQDERGETRTSDASRIDDPERPLLSSYELIEDRFLNLILPSDLTAEEVDGFFAGAGDSWRPYAAGMPWKRDESAWNAVRSRLRVLDRRGAEENRILYVSSESGAGATTFVRDLAWRAAGLGYPTLVARRGMIPLSGLEMANFLARLTSADREPESSRLYEVPCVIVFDREHWEGRDDDLLSFAREVERSGRRVCILVVTGPIVGLKVLSESRFVRIANLSHNVPSNQALALGHHLNRFLEPHGTARSEGEWRDFYNSSSVSEGQGIAAFWIVLSIPCSTTPMTVQIRQALSPRRPT